MSGARPRVSCAQIETKEKSNGKKFRIDFDQMEVRSVQMRRTEIHLIFDATMNEIN